LDKKAFVFYLQYSLVKVTIRFAFFKEKVYLKLFFSPSYTITFFLLSGKTIGGKTEVWKSAQRNAISSSQNPDQIIFSVS
jgi:hypothetical protein